MNDNFGNDIIRKFLEGDSVPSIVGVADIPNPTGSIRVGCIAADYSAAADHELYARNFEQSWTSGHFDDGFELAENPGSVRVSSKTRSHMMAFGGEHTNVLDTPSYYMDAPVEDWSLAAFKRESSACGMWLFHIKTTLASYLFIHAYPACELLGKYRKPPMEIHLKEKP